MSVRSRSYSNKQRDDKNSPRQPDPIPVINVPNTSVPNTEFVYYTGNYTNTGTTNSLAEYRDTRTDPIVDRASDYKLAIVKFNIRTDLIPMFNYVNKSFIVYMYYAPDNILITQQVQPTVGVTYSQEEFLNYTPGGLNEALSDAFNALVAAYEVIYGPASWTGDAAKPQFPPGMQFDPATGLFTMFIDERSISNAPNEVQTFMSPDLGRLFTGLSVTPFFSTPSLPSGTQKFLFWYNFTRSNTFPVPGGGGVNYVSNTGIYNSTSLWYEISRIIITSNSLATRRNFVGGGSNGQSDVQLPIITDFTFVTDNGPQNNPTTWYEYQPSGPYRWVDIFGDGPVNRLDLKFYYATSNGEIQPLYVQPGDSFSFTLLFAKVVL